MKAIRQWMAAALALALAASLSISCALAASPAEPFADFRIDAADMDVPDRALPVDLYHRNENGSLLPAGATTLNCKVNRVTGDATFYIQSNAEGVWMTVDYLTDVNGDGMYELLEGGDTPGWDSLTAAGELVQGGNEALAVGQPYILSAGEISDRFDKEAQARAQGCGIAEYSPSIPLCRVTLNRIDPAGGQEHKQVYYLEIFEDILLPGDVLPGEPWYDAVVYCLGQGWFTGLEDGSFGPGLALTRAQLALVLWRVGGCPEAEPAGFSDVQPDDWYYPAVSWCRQEGIIAGYADGSFLPDAPLTREQMVSFLHRYARPSAAGAYSAGDLSRFDGHEEVSSWAYDSMCWAVSNRLLSTPDNALRPGNTVTRAELAVALYAYQNSLASPRLMW